MPMLTIDSAADSAKHFIETIEPYSNTFAGRGIVICAGGVRYNTCAWVLIRMLRRLGCELPIEVWYLGEDEEDPNWIELVERHGVRCIDAHKVRRQHPHPRLRGWELKPYAILHSRFREVLFLDADNVPVVDPTFLFDTPQYERTHTIFWPDPIHHRTTPESVRWKIFGVERRDEPDQESGQLLVDKRHCWKALNLCNWYNTHSDFFYQHIYGDKDTFRFAWRRTDSPIAWPGKFADDSVACTLLQHDFSGHVLFQHRFADKWSLFGNRRVSGFLHEDACIDFVCELAAKWSPVLHLMRHASQEDRKRMHNLSRERLLYQRVGRNRHAITLLPNGNIETGRGANEAFWWMEAGQLVIADANGCTTCRMREHHGHTWKGLSAADTRVAHRLLPASGHPTPSSRHPSGTHPRTPMSNFQTNQTARSGNTMDLSPYYSQGRFLTAWGEECGIRRLLWRW